MGLTVCMDVASRVHESATLVPVCHNTESYNKLLFQGRAIIQGCLTVVILKVISGTSLILTKTSLCLDQT